MPVHFTTSGPSFGAPASSQRSSVVYISLPFSKRLPPVCGDSPSDLVNIIDASGTARLMRRPGISRVMRKWSPSGSKPKSERRNPSCPRAAPWQRLQSAFMKTGMTSSRKEIGRSSVAFSTFTGTSAVCPCHATLSVVSPSATGVTVCLSNFAFDGSATSIFASSVTSRWTPLGFGEADDDRLAITFGLEVDVLREDLEIAAGLEGGERGGSGEGNQQGQGPGVEMNAHRDW